MDHANEALLDDAADTILESQVLTELGHLSGWLDSEDRWDIYRFTAPYSGKLVVRPNFPSSSDINFQLLFNSWSADNLTLSNGSTNQSPQLKAGETYYFSLSSRYYPDTTQFYDFDLTFEPTRFDPLHNAYLINPYFDYDRNRIDNGGQFSISSESGYWWQDYLYQAESDAEVSVQISAGNVSLIVVEAFGDEVFTQYDANTLTLRFPVNADKFYYIHPVPIDASDLLQSATFTFQLEVPFVEPLPDDQLNGSPLGDMPSHRFYSYIPSYLPNSGDVEGHLDAFIDPRDVYTFQPGYEFHKISLSKSSGVAVFGDYNYETPINDVDVSEQMLYFNGNFISFYTDSGSSSYQFHYESYNYLPQGYLAGFIQDRNPSFIENTIIAYLAIYQRPADPQGLLNWTLSDLLAPHGWQYGGVTEGFINSAEFDEIGAPMGENYINHLVNALFEREATAKELVDYSDLASHYSTRDQVLIDIVQNASEVDAAVMNSKVTLSREITVYANEAGYSFNRDTLAELLSEAYTDLGTDQVISTEDLDLLHYSIDQFWVLGASLL